MMIEICVKLKINPYTRSYIKHHAQLEIEKARGPDGISPRLLVELAEVLAMPVHGHHRQKSIEERKDAHVT